MNEFSRYFDFVKRYAFSVKSNWPFMWELRRKFMLFSSAAIAIYGWSAYSDWQEQKRLSAIYDSYENYEAERFAYGDRDELRQLEKEEAENRALLKNKMSFKKDLEYFNSDEFAMASPQVKMLLSAQNIIFGRYEKVCDCQKSLANFERCQLPVTSFKASFLMSLSREELNDKYKELVAHDEISQKNLGVCRHKLGLLKQLKKNNAEIDSMILVAKKCVPQSMSGIAINLASFKQNESYLQVLQSEQDYENTLMISQNNLIAARTINESVIKQNCVALKNEEEKNVRTVSSAN